MAGMRPTILSDRLKQNYKASLHCGPLVSNERLRLPSLDKHTEGNLESAIDNRPPSNIGRACITTKEAKHKIMRGK